MFSWKKAQNGLGTWREAFPSGFLIPRLPFGRRTLTGWSRDVSAINRANSPICP
ncbi:MAG: hypothetical protein BWX50_00118 [Euryarchaeota archaeon ADurb.Bin009]|nr:MAG: hypothetical protein BWX50_00118 [Euryarchaeota archaeon ADurb.Bin009]